jgi:superkiller protein 3
MKHTLFYAILCLLLLASTTGYAREKTFRRSYTYRASEDDSKNTARTQATTQMRTLLLREVGQFLKTEQIVQTGASVEYSEKIEAVTAGIVAMKVLNETWNGSTYYIEAEMTLDPDDVKNKLKEVLNDKQKTKELEESRRRTLAAEAEAAKLRQEMEQQRRQIAAERDEHKQQLAQERQKGLQASYNAQVDKLGVEEYITKGNNAGDGGFYELAIEYFQKAIAIDPNNAKAYFAMGMAYEIQGNHSQSIACLQKAITFDLNEANEAKAYFAMGIAYEGQSNDSQAITCLQKAIAIDPNYTDAYTCIGDIYRSQGNYSQTITCYQKVIAINPNNAVAYYNLGFVYGKQGNYSQSMTCFQKAIAIDPNYADAYFRMGDAYGVQGNHSQAIACYQKAIAIDPNNAMAYYNMGYSYKEQGNYSQAITCLQKAARLGNEYAQQWLRNNGYSW